LGNRPFIKELRTTNKPLQAEKQPIESKLNQRLKIANKKQKTLTREGLRGVDLFHYKLRWN
jgi:hypothetical protein